MNYKIGRLNRHVSTWTPASGETAKIIKETFNGLKKRAYSFVVTTSGHNNMYCHSSNIETQPFVSAIQGCLGTDDANIFDMYFDLLNDNEFSPSQIQKDNMSIILTLWSDCYPLDISFSLSADDEILIERKTARGINYIIIDYSDPRLFYALSGFNRGDIDLVPYNNSTESINSLLQFFNSL